MADIRHVFLIHAPRSAVFQALSSPSGLDAWWTQRASGEPVVGRTYQLGFGADHHWQAIVRRCVPDAVFELEFTSAGADWMGTGRHSSRFSDPRPPIRRLPGAQ